MEQASDKVGRDKPCVAIVFAQFAPYHVDRISAAAERLLGTARVLAIEVAGRSHAYAWERSGEVHVAEKRVLFPDASYEDLGTGEKLTAMWRAVRGCKSVFIGIPYSDAAVLALSWMLRFSGRRVVLMTESKADDAPRRWWRETGKRLLLGAYRTALVGGPRQAAYLRFLGFSRRMVLTGYDTVGVERVRALAAGGAQPPWNERPFLYVGRFVPKKNLFVLLEAYARYAAGAGQEARRLVLAGDGPLRAELRRHAEKLGIAGRLDWPGFLSEADVPAAMARALALLLVSTTEQWGLVVNEACAAGLPVIVSDNVGARETLVRDGLTGFVVAAANVRQIADRMHALASSEAAWQAMRCASVAQAEQGDVIHFADAVAKLIAPAGQRR